jgi:hypothetical protein
MGEPLGNFKKQVESEEFKVKVLRPTEKPDGPARIAGTPHKRRDRKQSEQRGTMKDRRQMSVTELFPTWNEETEKSAGKRRPGHDRRKGERRAFGEKRANPENRRGSEGHRKEHRWYDDTDQQKPLQEKIVPINQIVPEGTAVARLNAERPERETGSYAMVGRRPAAPIGTRVKGDNFKPVQQSWSYLVGSGV